MSLLTKLNPLAKTHETDIWRPATRWDPVREMEDLMRGMQRVFYSLPAKTDESMSLADWSPSVDIAEDEKEYVVKAELPQVKKEDIKVSVENGNLSISGERKVENEETNLKFHRIERAYGRFERTFSLPDETDQEKVTSEYKDGILTIHLPKSPTVKPASHVIPVN